MPRLVYSRRFVADLAAVESPNLEKRILGILDCVEAFADFGSANVPESVKQEFGDGVRKVAVNPFDLVYTVCPESDIVRIEALIHQRAAW